MLHSALHYGKNKSRMFHRHQSFMCYSGHGPRKRGAGQYGNNCTQGGSRYVQECRRGEHIVSYDSTSIRTAFDGIIADIEQINTLVIAVITGMASDLSGTVVSEVKTAANAASTLISLLKAMVDMTARRSTVGTTLTAQEAIGRITVFVATHGA